MLKLLELDYSIEYKHAKENTAPNAPARLHGDAEAKEHHLAISATIPTWMT